MDDSQRQLIRHYLATIAYRTRKAVVGAPEGFGQFRPGHGARTPAEILNHMRGRIVFVQGQLGAAEATNLDVLPWADEVAAFSASLAELDGRLAEGASPSALSVERLLQGPLSDVMTHVGQIAMLRRFAGSPVPAENFSRAAIEAGDVGIELG